MADVGTFPDKPNPADNDKIVLADTAASDAARRIDVSALRGWGYGSIYVAGGAGSQVLTGPGTFNLITQFDSNTVSRSTTPDHTLDKVTIDEAGIWRVHFSLTCEWLTAAAAVEARIYNDSVPVETQIRAKQALALAAGQQFTLSAGGILDISTVPADIVVRAESSLGSNAIRVVHGSIVVDRVGVA